MALRVGWCQLGSLLPVWDMPRCPVQSTDGIVEATCPLADSVAARP